MKLTQSQQFAANALMQSLGDYGYTVRRDMKHNHWYDFGYPSELNFEQLHTSWSRSGFAKGLTGKTTDKTWQTMPSLFEKEPERALDQKETAVEKTIRNHFSDIRFWQKLATADERSLVGKYAAVILRFGDGRPWHEPVGRVGGGPAGLVEVIPAWEGQLTIEYDSNPNSDNYGKPKKFMFNEQAVEQEHGQVRQMTIHPDRVFVWSRDGTTHCEPKLSPAYNALLDMEKIRGSGAAGFWKNAKSQPVLTASPDINVAQLAQMLGTDAEGLADKLDEVVEKWSRGFDASLMLQGMDAKTLQVSLPSPEHFFNIAVQEVSASWPIPQKVLVGMQTGERASTEDANEWSQIIMARRERETIPNIMDIINRLEKFGVLPKRDWYLDWQDLTSPTQGQRFDIVGKMAEINSKMAATGDVVFSDDEMRSVVDYPAKIDDFMEPMDDEATDDPAQQNEPNRPDGQD